MIRKKCEQVYVETKKKKQLTIKKTAIRIKQSRL